jgi:hypothetical protein
MAAVFASVTAVAMAAVSASKMVAELAVVFASVTEAARAMAVAAVSATVRAWRQSNASEQNGHVRRVLLALAAHVSTPVTRSSSKALGLADGMSGKHSPILMINILHGSVQQE